ncbi:M48 family metallopeptidase [Candidatus Marinarcus aquaticus]|uniref:Peptidase M48 family protein n=1 Tax=Candidatus Marinarcus aquaticus TaxID=2044504 RepID=A0A4Q0XXZ6_9BACT|nr:M48 family metallopeptidase [Candidatus Marinarcus aquaticus]RXJ60821.1 peptidase M48 family protein [Candidatus Marinarcus aquaticus]
MRFKTSLLLAITALLFIGCTSKTPYTNRSQFILLSQSQELALGEQTYKETLDKSKVIMNTIQAKMVKNIGAKIAKVANKKDYEWEFNLVQNSEKNAFCLPGGKVVVYTGIFSVAKNEDQLATVISHEIAHALARHGAERMSQSMVAQGIQVVGNIVVGSQAPQYTQAFNVAYGLGSQYGVLMPYGRMQESEADEIGVHLMKQAGYDLNEALKFWENMSQGNSEGIEFFSTHPNSKTRIENIKRIIKELNKK